MTKPGTSHGPVDNLFKPVLGRNGGAWTSGCRRTGSRRARPPAGAPVVVRGAGCGSRRMVERAPASIGCAATWLGAWGGRPGGHPGVGAPGVGATNLGGLDQRRARIPGLDLLDHREGQGKGPLRSCAAGPSSREVLLGGDRDRRDSDEELVSDGIRHECVVEQARGLS